MASTSDTRTVVGAFENRREAEQAVEELHRAGFRDDQIGIAARDADRVEGTTEIEDRGSNGSGAAGGLVTGGVIGGILGALAAGLIPGIGPVIAGGILAGVVGGAAVGAAAGGLLGALMGMGVPEEEAHYYNSEFEAGRTIVTVKPDGRYDEARAILQRYGVLEYSGRTAMNATGTTPRTDVRETRTVDTSREGPVELREEELQPRKETVQSGEATIRKDVVAQEKTIDVPVTHEELTVERRPVDRKPADRPIGDSETITVPLREEQVELEKETVVYEEVELGKRPVTETERVSGTVRREEVRMDREGDVPMASGTTGYGFRPWEEVEPTYRQEWQARYGTSGQRWEDVEPYRRYGYEMAYDPRYQNREWSDVEPGLRSDYSDWSRRYNYRSDESGWDRFKDQVRMAWEEARAKVRR